MLSEALLSSDIPAMPVTSLVVSPVVLADQNLVDNIENCLGVWEVPNNCLILEVTESTALADPATDLKALMRG